MTDDVRDLEAVRRIASRDEAALSDLYAVYGQRMYAYALRLTGSVPLAEDVVQDALVAVWRSAGRFRGTGRVVAWLLGIVHHTALKAMRHPTQPMSEAMEAALVAADPLPEEQLQIEERAQCVRRALGKLSLQHRAVLELVYYHDLSLDEVAGVCKCPLGTVKSRLSYARRYLRDALRMDSRMEDG